MESRCSVLVHHSLFPNGLSGVGDVVKLVDGPMDCVSSSSDSIVINSESSKDDSASSYDDTAAGVRPEENGIGCVEQASKKPTIMLAKTVTLRNFESMSSSLVMNPSETADKSNDCDDTAEESISVGAMTQVDDTAKDPLANSIVLSESDGETTNDGADTAQQMNCEVVAGEGLPGRIQVRVPSTENGPSTPSSVAGKDSSTTVPESANVEILSADTPQRKQELLKLVLPSSAKKTTDGIVQPVKINSELQECLQCNKNMNCTMMLDLNGVKCYLCSDKCMVENRFAQKASLQRAFHKPLESNRPAVVRKCGQCKEAVTPSDNILSWETMDFCNEDCLKLYQNKLGLQCSYCQLQCQEQSLGKYCVRFGFDIRQFCHSSCLEEYKKGIKVCSFCQEDIPNNQGFMAAINDRQQFKEFCSEDCMTNYDKMSSNMPVRLTASRCDVCNKFKLVTVEVIKAGKCFNLCSDVCFSAFKFVHSNPMGFCDMCRKNFDTENVEELFYTFSDDAAITFCSKTCMNAYVIFKRKIVQCNWCKVKKYNFDMIKKIFSNRQVMMLCSFHCFSMWKQSPKRNTCDHCKTFGQIQYHLGMSDGTLRSFCGHECLMKFQLQFKKVPVTPSSARPLDASATVAYPVMTTTKIPQVSVKAPLPKKTTENSGVVVATPGNPNSLAQICAPACRINDNTATIPVISSVTSLEPSVQAIRSPLVSESSTVVVDKPLPLPVTVNTPKPPPRKSVGVIINKGGMGMGMGIGAGSQVLVKQQLLLVPPQPVAMCNKSTYFNCYPTTKSKGIFCRPNALPQSTQTDFDSISDLVAKDSDDVKEEDEEDEGTDERMKEKDGKSRTKSCPKILERIKEVPVVIPIPLPIYIPVPIPMYSVPVPTPVPIPLPVPLCLPTPHQSLTEILNEIQELCCKLPEKAAQNRRRREENGLFSYDGVDIDISSNPNCRKRGHSIMDESEDASGSGEGSNKRRKLEDGSSKGEGSGSSSNNPEGDESSQQGGSSSTPPAGGSGGGHQPPDESRLSKTLSTSSPKRYIQSTFGVNAWKKWVTTKNQELVSRGEKPFGTEILWLSGEELCESLALFVTEFRKPSGQAFPADIIFYLVLGIQAYLLENGRGDNILSNSAYSKFMDTFDEIIVKDTVLDNSEFLVPRIEEEHLWESNQLGVSSPICLLQTILYFTTKGFYITDVDSHMSLAFSQLMRQWPRGQSSSEKLVTKHQSLRYFPPNQPRGENSKDSSGQENRKKYEILENVDSNFRCPVRLYDFYVSKCPVSVRNRSDVFYLRPEESYLSDSPVWYSTEPLDRAVLSKMFNRLRLVKEISLIVNSELSTE